MSVNIRPYIIINGKNSNEVSGLMISSLPPISKPAMRVEAEEIDGRDGDIVTELGFSAYDKEIEIGLCGNYDVNEIIEYFNQSGQIIFSNEPDKYYRFAQYNGIDFEKLVRYKTAKVVFHCQPFKFDLVSNDAVFFNPTNVSVVNEGNIYSKPELAVYGSGDVGISVNGSDVLEIDLGATQQAIIIDSDGMNAYGANTNIQEIVVDVDAVQAGSGEPSPDHISPITGWSECNVCNTPMPVSQLWTIDSSFNGTVEFNQLVQNGNFADTSGYNFNIGTGSVNNNVLTFTSGSGNRNYVNKAITIPNVSNHKYLFTFGYKSNLSFSCQRYAIATVVNISANSEWTNYSTVINGNGSSSYNSTYFFNYSELSVGDWVLNLRNYEIIDLSQMFGSTIADYIYTLEQGESGAGVAFFRSIYPNDYYAYDTGTDEMVGSREGNTYTIPFGQTIYGASLNVSTGVLTVTHGYVDLGSLNWNLSGGVFYSSGISSLVKNNELNTVDMPYICEIYKHRAFAGLPDFCCAYFQNNIRIKDSRYTDTTDFKNAVNGVKYCYELATQQTIQLSAEEIMTIVGQNNIFADTGAINELIYTKDDADITTSGDIVSFDVDVADIKDNIFKNRLVIGNYDNLKLKAGTNLIGVSGDVSVLVLSNFSRWL